MEAINTEWIQFGIILVTFVGLFIWNRTEARADNRHMDAKLESNRNLSIQIHNENRQIIDSIKEDMKEFHIRMEKQDSEFKTHLIHLLDKK